MYNGCTTANGMSQLYQAEWLSLGLAQALLYKKTKTKTLFQYYFFYKNTKYVNKN